MASRRAPGNAQEGLLGVGLLVDHEHLLDVDLVGHRDDARAEQLGEVGRDLVERPLATAQDGHPAGDVVLVACAEAWRRTLPRGAFLARYGGEEFALLIPGLDDDVITRAPAPAAPYTMLIAATSLSAWRNTPFTCGSLLAIYSISSLCGVIGYPK